MPSFAEGGALKIGYKGTMFQQPECSYSVSHVVPEGESPEETKLLVAAYKKLWESRFAKSAKEAAKNIRTAMEGTEKDWKKKPPADMEKAAAVANKMIQQGVDVWRTVTVPKLAQECLNDCYKAMEKKLKRTLTKKKVKTVLKIVALVLIVVAVAAVSAAATILSGGAAAIVVIGVIGTVTGALISSGKIIYKEYNAYEAYLDKIQKDLDAINKAIAYEKKKAEKQNAGVKLGPKERAKLYFNGSKGHVKSLKKHLAAAEGRLLLLRKELHKAIVEADEAAKKHAEMSSHPDKAISAEAKEAKKQAYLTARKLEKLNTKFKKFAELKAEANKQLASLEKSGDFTSENASKILKFVRDNEATVSFLLSAVKSLGTGAKKIAKALN